MDIWAFVAMFAVILTAIQLFPQVYQTLKTRKVRDLSLSFSLLIAAGCLLWLAYGIHIQDWPIIIANAINLIGASILVYLKIITK